MILAYNPLIPLVESYVAIYKIYVLMNPLKNNEVFYVGQTLKDVKERLNQHICQTETNVEKIKYISEILAMGSKPVIEAIEVIRGTCYIDKQMVNERELYWIKYYKAFGCKLLNSAGISPNARCSEYHGYLASIKKGESDWKYYYCGKTAGGFKVYDDKKIEADGFAFPKQDEEVPYLNDTIRKKLGLPLGGDYATKHLKSIITEIFPEQPSWTIDFAYQIPYTDDLMEDMEIDDCDDEYEECENDDSDYEDGGDYEDELSDIIEPEYDKSLYIDNLFITAPVFQFSLSPKQGITFKGA